MTNKPESAAPPSEPAAPALVVDWRLVAGDVVGRLYQAVAGTEIVDEVNAILKKHTHRIDAALADGGEGKT